MHRLGIMQGRLLPPVGGRIQAFPGPGWQREFALAAEIGFAAIELTIETASMETHPLLRSGGRAELRRLSRDHGVALAGLCCDVFMETPLVAATAEERGAALSILDALIAAAAEAELPMIELPMLQANSLGPPGAEAAFAPALAHALSRGEVGGVDILLEADLPPAPFTAFLARNRHSRLGVNYDCGNSTYFGFDPDVEIPALAGFIRNVHLKDCTRADYSVPLGQGETRFDAVFGQLAQAGYRGELILQAARQADEVATARQYLSFCRPWLAEPAPSDLRTCARR